jgi:hypothetical protein
MQRGTRRRHERQQRRHRSTSAQAPGSSLRHAAGDRSGDKFSRRDDDQPHAARRSGGTHVAAPLHRLRDGEVMLPVVTVVGRMSCRISRKVCSAAPSRMASSKPR